jgi:beta-ribofuranosylaminobenzene 5'-phosphate synthase
MTMDQLVRVEAPARLHFGVLDLRGHLGRRFGGIGAAVPAPSVVVEAQAAPVMVAEGPDQDRALEFALRYLESAGIGSAVGISVRQAIPAHSGLGSGTQLGLAVARALAELFERDTETARLAAAVGRGQRSAIGTWTFDQGGFILEGGRRPGSARVAPLLARLPMPASWWCVVVVPEGTPGLSGEAEAAAFRNLPAPTEREVERVAHLVLMQLMPALADEDLPAFGTALSEIQRVTGGWFAPAQGGGAFAAGATGRMVRTMAEWGAAGVGQSSWGPALYGIAEGEPEASRLAERARAVLNGRGAVYLSQFTNQGARVERSRIQR